MACAHSYPQRATEQLAAAQRELLLVPLARQLTHLGAWQAFMRLHVFAVWDFMSLLKRLQRELTCLELPWRPPKASAAARLINEIVLVEESDVDGQGGYTSHFELYRKAMHDAQADSGPIDRTMQALQQGATPGQALAQAQVPTAVVAFVEHTLELALHGPLPQVAAAFLYGREAVLPALFSELLAQLQQRDERLSTLAYYFQRHIEVDGDEHGPMAQALLSSICQDDSGKWEAAVGCAKKSLALRQDLWQAIEHEVRRGQRAG